MYEVSQCREPKLVFDAAKAAETPDVAPASTRYHGPDRRAPSISTRDWLAATLDEIDYGTLLLTRETHVVHVSSVARSELDGLHPLQLQADELRARRPQDAAPLGNALRAAASRGLRRLLTLGEGSQRISISVVPLSSFSASDGPITMIMLGKRQVCEELSVQGFARSHGLTAAETRVLALLCKGLSPNGIAAELGVGIATVRTQIGNIRAKTGAENIGALMQQVAVLPPLMSVLHRAARRLETVRDGGLVTA